MTASPRARVWALARLRALPVVDDVHAETILTVAIACSPHSSLRNCQFPQVDRWNGCDGTDGTRRTGEGTSPHPPMVLSVPPKRGQEHRAVAALQQRGLRVELGASSRMVSFASLAFWSNSTAAGSPAQEQLYAEARRRGVKGRSSMTKAQRVRAVGR